MARNLKEPDEGADLIDLKWIEVAILVAGAGFAVLGQLGAACLLFTTDGSQRHEEHAGRMFLVFGLSSVGWIGAVVTGAACASFGLLRVP
jgi:hypothetical protein